MNKKLLSLVVDMYGCPNRCRHCWLGHMPNIKMEKGADQWIVDYFKPYFEKIGIECPKCGKDIVLKKTKKGRKYFGCIDNPECDYMVWQKPSRMKCDKCGDLLLEKGNKLVCPNEECGNIVEKK